MVDTGETAHKPGYCSTCRRYYTAQYYSLDDYIANNPSLFSEASAQFIDDEKQKFMQWCWSQGAELCPKPNCKKSVVFIESETLDRMRRNRRPSKRRKERHFPAR